MQKKIKKALKTLDECKGMKIKVGELEDGSIIVVMSQPGGPGQPPPPPPEPE